MKNVYLYSPFSCFLLLPVSVKNQGLMTVKFAPEIILIAREEIYLWAIVMTGT